MKYFLTGATGFIGGRLAKRLVQSGHEVVALVRPSTQTEDLRRLGVELVQGDITDKESLRAPMQGVDGVFHLAGWYKIGVRDKSAGYNVNVLGTKNVLDMMVEQGIRKGVYTSTLAVNSDTKGQIVNEGYKYEGPHLSEYDRTKWLAHYDIALGHIADGLPLVIVMPGVVYGRGDNSLMGMVIERYLKGHLGMIPLQSAYSWAYVDDIVDGHLSAMDKGVVGESYILAGPSHTFEEAFAIASKITGIQLPRIRIPPSRMRMISKIVYYLDKIIPFPPYYSFESLNVSSGATYLGDNSKARESLGFNPRTLEEGFKIALKEIQEEMDARKS